MSGRLQIPTWYAEFRSEMEAIGCVFGDGVFDEDIKVPLDRQDEAKAIIRKYMVKS